MKKLNKKGFTLIELMAVVIILIVIIFIAVVRINQSTKNAKLNSTKANALSYIKAVKEKVSVDSVETEQLDSGIFTIADLKKYGVSLSGKTPDGGYVIVSDYKVIDYCLAYNSYKVTRVSENENAIEKGTCDIMFADIYEQSSGTFDFNAQGSGYQTFTAPEDGNYLIQLWGAQGNYPSNKRSLGGLGAYTQGVINLEAGTTLYVYVGENRTDRIASFNAGGTFGTDRDGTNGGDYNGYGGGGATDIRLASGAWNDDASLRSRIMVAAGGGGATNYAYPANGGYGGALVGGSGFNGKYPNNGTANTPPTGATQVTGGVTSSGAATIFGTSGTFGKAGNSSSGWGSSGGGGYYGGAGGGVSDYSVDSGAGGSSFISGHTGCVAIKSSLDSSPKDGCTDGTTDNDCSIHYSDYVFISTDMKAGNEYMPNHDGTSTMKGNSGSGYARITYLGNLGESDSSREFAFKFPNYKRVEYLQSHGSEYINTNILPTNTTGAYAKVVSQNTSTDLIYFGSKPSGDARFWVGNTSNTLYFGWNGSQGNRPSVNTSTESVVHMNYLNDRKLVHNGSEKFTDIGTLNTNDKPIYVFAGNNNGTANYYSSIMLYFLKISNGSKVIADYIPCINPSGIAGLCEMLSGSFLSNVGSGSFETGPEI